MTGLFARTAVGRFMIAGVLAWALLASVGTVSAQAEDIAFRVEIFRVDLVRGDDGEVTERLTEVDEAVAGEVIEYQVTAVNEGDIIYRPGTVVVTLPLGEGVAYLEDTATQEEDRVLVEFSGDGGETFSEPPVLLGEEGERSTVPPEAYDAIRWTFTVPFEPEQEETLTYRVEVQ